VPGDAAAARAINRRTIYSEGIPVAPGVNLVPIPAFATSVQFGLRTVSGVAVGAPALRYLIFGGGPAPIELENGAIALTPAAGSNPFASARYPGESIRIPGGARTIRLLQTQANLVLSVACKFDLAI
jgi:hypothetical protein